MTLHEALQRYRAMGFAPIPIVRNAKKPTANAEQWSDPKRHWNEPSDYPDGCNIALRTGEISGKLLDVDIDSALASQLAPLLLPPSGMTIVKPDGGHPRITHLMYRLKPDQKPTKNNIKLPCADGQIELRYDSHYTVVPPSVISGTPREWQGGLREPLVVDWEFVYARARVLALATYALLHYHAGQRHNYLLAVIGICARNGVPEDDALLVVDKILQATGDTERSDRVTIVRTTYARERNGDPIAGYTLLTACGIPEAEAQRIADGIRKLYPAPKPAPTPATSTQTPEQPAPIRIRKYGTVETETAIALVPHLIYEERITILAGAPGVGKTTFALEIADALTRTGKLWGNTVETPKARVLWLDFDHSAGRLREILDNYYGDDERELYFPERDCLAPLDITTLAAYRALIEQEAIDLIVADTALDWLAVADPNDDAQARAAMQLLRDLIAGTNCAVLLLHHLRKSAENAHTTHALAGSARWSAKADVIALLSHASEDGVEKVKLTIVKDRDGERTTLEFTPKDRRFLPIDTRQRKTELQTIRDYIARHGAATYEQLHDALQRAGFRLSRKTLEKRIQRWSKRGVLLLVRSGFPAKTLVTTPTPQMRHPETPDVATVATVATGGNCDGVGVCPDATDATDTTDTTHSCHGGSECRNCTPPPLPPSPMEENRAVYLDWERGAITREQHKRRRLRNGHDSAYAAAQHTLPL